MKLSDHFGKFTCKALKSELGITAVEEALKLSDKTLMRCKGIGVMFCYHLRQLETKIPSGERMENTQIHTYMFILRRLLGEEGVESNTILGDSYNVVYKATMPQEFRKAHENYFGPPQTGENESDDVVAFITFQDGSRIQALYKGQPSYVMTPNGATFSGLIIK